ncbi:MAG: GNAT family N-acetyltransferase [Acidimicrobiales bacterium]
MTTADPTHPALPSPRPRPNRRRPPRHHPALHEPALLRGAPDSSGPRSRPPGGVAVLALADGSRVQFRRARAGDEAGMLALYEYLSPQSRYTRYCQATPRLNEERRREIADLSRGPVWLAHVGGRCVGEARLVASRSGELHVAMAVADGFQRRGVGRRLGELLLADPEGRHRDVVVSILATNTLAVRLARRAGFNLALDAGTVEGRLHRAPAVERSRLVVP